MYTKSKRSILAWAEPCSGVYGSAYKFYDFMKKEL